MCNKQVQHRTGGHDAAFMLAYVQQAQANGRNMVGLPAVVSVP